MRSFDFSFLKEYQSSSLDMIIISMLIGIIIAVIAIIYHNVVLGNFVRTLINKKALSEQSAVTLSEIKYNKNVFIKFALRDSSTFRKTVHISAGEDNAAKKYFIPEAIHEREEARYSKKGTGILTLILALAVFAALALIALNIIPYFTNTLTNIIS